MASKLSKIVFLTTFVVALNTYAFHFSGSGFYSVRPILRSMKGYGGVASQKAFEQSFRLLGEAKLNERLSCILQIGLWDEPYQTFMGDQVDGFVDKEGKGYQDPFSPSYKDISPKIRNFYAQYNSEWFVLKAGRRDRQWGLGILHHKGDQPFDVAGSHFDGISVHVDPQDFQPIGFSIGFDKLQESIFLANGTLRHGAGHFESDMNQYFATIEYNDTYAGVSSSLFRKHIGIYAAIIDSGEIKDHGSETDLKVLDLYISFYPYWADLVWKNEALMFFGKTGAISSKGLGGALVDEDNKMALNEIKTTVAYATNLEWFISRSGSYQGPKEYNRGDASSHSLVFDYVYVPGDSNGYYKENNAPEGYDHHKRSKEAKALKLHPNYKLGLILFNGRDQLDPLTTDGVFSPNQMMNTSVYSLAYRYQSLGIGNIEGRLTYARLNADMPSELKTYYKEQNDVERQVGYYGKDLGFELDTMYNYPISNELELGAAFGFLFAGKGWQIKEDKRPENAYIVQSHITFKF